LQHRLRPLCGGADLVQSLRVVACAALGALAVTTLLAFTPPGDMTERASDPARTSSVPASTPVSFASFPDSYFAASTFSLSAPPPTALGFAVEPETMGSVGMQLASVTSTPVLDPPVKPKSSSYGIASFYRYDTRTASGERFDARELTAAHRTLPFGTRLRVTSVATGRSVTVRVNDRGPYVPGRVVDLSYSAAEQIGMVGRGVTKVKLEVIQ
jgi:rare lipoprotein A (peptidoglycan hydrolase)